MADMTLATAMAVAMQIHLDSCGRHQEHALVAAGVTAMCCDCNNFICEACGAQEEWLPGQDAKTIQSTEQFLCALVIQGDAFNLKHSKCKGGHHAHIH